MTPRTIPAGEGFVSGGAVLSRTGLWVGGSVQANTVLRVPLTLAGLVVVFMLVQWLVDHRDPKLVEAPARKDDDSVGFE